MLLESAEKDRIRTVATILRQAARPIKILSAIGWPDQIKADFLASGGTILPQVEYPMFDPQPVLELVREAKRNIFGGSLIDSWL